MHDDHFEPFWVRYNQKIIESIIIVGLSAFLVLYLKLPPYREFLNTFTRPIVKGGLVLYGHTSTFVHRLTGLDIGLINEPTDPDFMFRVQLATYINERKAGPLLDVAMNPRMPVEKREMAIKGLLQFDSIADWIQPFINELSKGGLIELDQRSPVLNELFSKIREEGGIRNPLVRAYAEVVFAFMLQSVKDDVRLKSLGWVSDVMAEDALFLIVPRLTRENADTVRAEIEKTLLGIRAISDRERAKEQLVMLFNKPPWPGLKFPLGIILARLGYDKAMMYVRKLDATGDFEREQEVPLRVALARTPYPAELKISNRAELVLQAKKKARLDQYAAAYRKQQRIVREQMLAAASSRKSTPSSSSPPVLKEARLPKSETGGATPLPPQLAKLLKEEIPPDPIVQPTVKPVKTSVAAPAQSVRVSKARKEPVSPEVIEEVPALVTQASPELPHGEGSDDSSQSKRVELARLPEEPQVVPPLPSQMPGTKMKGVDIYFEVKKQEVPLYMNPGNDHPTGDVLLPGSKGKADFEVQVDDERWLQVKSKDKVGWINAAQVSAFDLSPDADEMMRPASRSAATPAEGSREERTFFEPNAGDVKIYSQTSEKAKAIGVLSEGRAYLALKSEKVGPDRWFLLELDDKRTGWVHGYDLKLADAVQAKIQQAAIESKALGLAKSAFAAEWVVASVKGVLVYVEPELSAKQVKKISPPVVYKVVDIVENEFGEWYRIALGEKEGWVQSMDVNLTKPTAN